MWHSTRQPALAPTAAQRTWPSAVLRIKSRHCYHQTPVRVIYIFIQFSPSSEDSESLSPRLSLSLSESLFLSMYVYKVTTPLHSLKLSLRLVICAHVGARPPVSSTGKVTLSGGPLWQGRGKIVERGDTMRRLLTGCWFGWKLQLDPVLVGAPGVQSQSARTFQL